MKAGLSTAGPARPPGVLLRRAPACKLAALCSAWLPQTPTTCLLLSGSGRQLGPAEPPGDADADADAEEEDSVSFYRLGFFWRGWAFGSYLVKTGC